MSHLYEVRPFLVASKIFHVSVLNRMGLQVRLDYQFLAFRHIFWILVYPQVQL
jgi:hypothetical protein